MDQVLRPVGLLLTSGQSHDNPQLVPLLDDYQGWRRSAVRVRQGIHLVADKAYSHPSTRAVLRRRRVRHTIPERSDQRERRTAKGSKGGRPPNFDGQLYAKRNTIERSFGRLNQWRGIASRYDKYALTFLGGALLSAIVQFRR